MLKSTEIVIEQLIIGMLALVVVDLFAWGSPLPQLKPEESSYLPFFYGVFIVLAAYTAGIVVDRWSDTMLEQLERRIRIKVYLKDTTVGKFIGSNGVSLPNEAALRLEMLKNGDQIVEYHDYLRTRMRITRSVTCLMPALFLALALFDYQCQSQEVVRRSVGWGVGAYYAFFLIFCILVPKIFTKFEMPKTDNKEALIDYLFEYNLKNLLLCSKFLDEFRFRYYCDPAIISLALFGLLGTLLLIVLDFQTVPLNMSRVILNSVGLLLTYLTGWAWWRISKTFFTFISNYE